jgi:hypothetical protein
MKSSTEGICRVLPQNNSESPVARPSVKTTHSCKKWQDCGQQYYVRLGWIKGQSQATVKT